jgi:uncharacterized protein (DUF849 family)
MNREVILTCAVTGAGDTVGKHPDLPVTPEQIADSAIEAARAGASIVHIHVRDPATGVGSRDVTLYRETVDRIRQCGTDIVINLTAGMGGDLYLGPDEDPLAFTGATDVVGARERLVHVEELRPEICTLDCGSYNFGDGNLVYVSTPDMLRAGARLIRELGVKPELEVFDTGQLWFTNQMVDEGLLESPPLFQICLGIRWGAPADTESMKTMVDRLPASAVWSGFGIGAMQMPMVAQAVLLGGNVRVGLEDNLYLERGRFATNAELVERAKQIIELLGARVRTPAETRVHLGLSSH